jgi:hypothetical protein
MVFRDADLLIDQLQACGVVPRAGNFVPRDGRLQLRHFGRREFDLRCRGIEISQAERTYAGLPLTDQFIGSALVRTLANFVARKTSSRPPRIVRPISSSLSPMP